MLKLENISKSFLYHFKRTKVLHDINMEINRGDFSVILGKSGSGKTTLLNIIAGMLKPSSGKMYFENKRLSNFDFFKSRFRRKNIGFVFQNFNLIDYLSVLDNIILPFKFTSHSPVNHKKYGINILKKVGLEGKEHFFPAMLSGGQLQRCAIARALINKPKLIIADEPTGNLDADTAGEINNIFIDLNKNDNITFLVVTHDKNIVTHANKAYELKKGVLKNYNSNDLLSMESV